MEETFRAYGIRGYFLDDLRRIPFDEGWILPTLTDICREANVYYTVAHKNDLTPTYVF